MAAVFEAASTLPDPEALDLSEVRRKFAARSLFEIPVIRERLFRRGDFSHSALLPDYWSIARYYKSVIERGIFESSAVVSGVAQAVIEEDRARQEMYAELAERIPVTYNPAAVSDVASDHPFAIHAGHTELQARDKLEARNTRVFYQERLTIARTLED